MYGHLVMARFLSGSLPRGYRVDEGLGWCEALTVRFKRYEERSRRVGVSKLGQRSLTALVRGHMLKMKPEERESAPGCMERGRFVVAAAHTTIVLKVDFVEQDSNKTKSTPKQKMVKR